MWEMPNDWPVFILQGPVAQVLLGRLTEAFPDSQLLRSAPHG